MCLYSLSGLSSLVVSASVCRARVYGLILTPPANHKQEAPSIVFSCYTALCAYSVPIKMYNIVSYNGRTFFGGCIKFLDGHNIAFVIFSYHFCLVCPKTNTHTHTYTFFQLQCIQHHSCAALDCKRQHTIIIILIGSGPHEATSVSRKQVLQRLQKMTHEHNQNK